MARHGSHSDIDSPGPAVERSPPLKRKREDERDDRDRRERRRNNDRGNQYTSRKSGRGSESPKQRHRHKGGSESRSRERHARRSDSRSPQRRRSRSPRENRRHTRPRSRSPNRRPRSVSRSPPPRARQALPSQDQSFHAHGGRHEERSYKARGNRDGPSDALDKPVEKQKPNYKPSGLLAAESNKITVSGGSSKNPKSIVLKYHEPPEARKSPSSQPWSCYIFKGDSKDPVSTIPLHTRSCWLLGRETTVADIPIEHPSCSKQHAVFQFRYLTKKDEWGEKKGKVGLYLIDLESANGTFLNDEKVEQARYVECLNGDVVKFGESERDYVILLPPKE